MRPNHFFAALLLLFFASCQKEVEQPLPPPDTHPEMHHFSLNDRKIRYQGAPLSLDVNDDGSMDLSFGVQLVGDPIAKADKRQFMAASSYFTSLPVMEDEQVRVFQPSELIPITDFNGSRWYNASGIVLVQRVEHISGTITWQGNWLGASQRFLPFQVLKNEQRYNGWIELSVDVPNEEVILHRGAISKEAEKGVKAGF